MKCRNCPPASRITYQEEGMTMHKQAQQLVSGDKVWLPLIDADRFIEVEAVVPCGPMAVRVRTRVGQAMLSPTLLVEVAR